MNLISGHTVNMVSDFILSNRRVRNDSDYKVATLVAISGALRQLRARQMVEKTTKGDYWHAIHTAHNPLVVGSSPTGPTISIFTYFKSRE